MIVHDDSVISKVEDDHLDKIQYPAYVHGFYDEGKPPLMQYKMRKRLPEVFKINKLKLNRIYDRFRF